MATYHYKCLECEGQVEINRSVHDEETPPTCESCDLEMKKVFHSPSINLVGRGFYRNGG